MGWYPEPIRSLRVNSAKGLARWAKRSFASLRMTGLDLAGGEELSSAFEPCLKFLTWILDGARGADKSAVGAVNRPLQVSR